MQKILLELFRDGDIPEMLGWLKGTDQRFLCQFAGTRYRYPLDQAQLLETIASPDYLPFRAVNASGEGVGHCQFMRLDRRARSASIGRLLIAPEHRGKGLGAEMIHAMIRYAREELGLSALDLRVYDFNTRALELYRRLGFRDRGGESVSLDGIGEEWNCLALDLIL